MALVLYCSEGGREGNFYVMKAISCFFTSLSQYETKFAAFLLDLKFCILLHSQKALSCSQ